jgi:hypothetical protein
MIAALLVGTALAAPTGDALVGAPMARSLEPYAFSSLDGAGNWTGAMPYDRGPLTGEARGHLDVGAVGRGHARLGLGVRGWGARIDREPNTLAPREATVDLSIGLHKVAGARLHERPGSDPRVRAFFTADLGPALSLGWMRPWGASAVVGLPVAGGFGVDIGTGDVVGRVHLRAWGDLLTGGAYGSAASVGGSYQWWWDTGGVGLSLLAGIAFR